MKVEKFEFLIDGEKSAMMTMTLICLSVSLYGLGTKLQILILFESVKYW